MTSLATRRSFIAKTTGAAVFLPTAIASSGKLAATLAATPAAGEDYWDIVRGQFPFREAKVPMNAANLCPSPRCVAQRVTQLTHEIDVDCSFNNREQFKGLLEESRQRVARQLGVSADEIALVRNTSEANNTINNGLALKAGDEIVLWDQNHPTNNVAWDVRAARFGLAIKRVATPPRPNDVDELVSVFQNALTSKTRVLALTHVSNVSGIRLPVKELCDLARRRNIYVHVDGAQTWGALDVNLRQLGCDSYAASAHKWLVGPKEVGLLYVKQERIPEIWPNVVAPGWGTDAETDVHGARKFESMGQRDDAALSAVGDTVEFHSTIGAARIERRVHELAAYLKDSLHDAGFKFVTPLHRELSGGVCIVDVPQDRRGVVFEKLYSEHGIAGSTSGGLRLCPHIYNTSVHIQRAVQAVKAMRDLIVA